MDWVLGVPLDVVVQLAFDSVLALEDHVEHHRIGGVLGGVGLLQRDGTLVGIAVQLAPDKGDSCDHNGRDTCNECFEHYEAAFLDGGVNAVPPTFVFGRISRPCALAAVTASLTIPATVSLWNDSRPPCGPRNVKEMPFT